ncbi:MAG: cobalamin-binding protein [Phycisphaerales bacterium]|nr:MAG: cobalamin-binding protein [Phycisphaerales bacterium]
MRVVSLLPSATETLCVAGGSELLVGRSHECDAPADILDRPVLTSQNTDFDALGGSSGVDRAVSASLREGRSLYTLDSDLLRSLKPDLILTQDLCEVCSIDLNTVRAVAAGMSPAPEVLSLNPATFEDVLDDVLRVGRAIGREAEAGRAMMALRDRFFAAAELVTPYVEGPRVVFLEWTDPPFIGGHWTPQLIERAGATHPLNPTAPMPGAGAGAGGQMAHRVAGKSIRVPPEAIVGVAPEVVIVCPCGLTLDQTRAETRKLAESAWWADLPAVRAGRVAIVDGNQMFNRPGPRLVDAYEWLVGWLNDRPERIPEGFPWERFEG